MKIYGGRRKLEILIFCFRLRAVLTLLMDRNGTKWVTIDELRSNVAINKHMPKNIQSQVPSLNFVRILVDFAIQVSLWVIGKGSKYNIFYLSNEAIHISIKKKHMKTRAVHESWLSSLESSLKLLLFPGAESRVESQVISLESESSRVIAKVSRVIIAQLFVSK